MHLFVCHPCKRQLGAADGLSRMDHSGRKDTQSREYPSGDCCSTTPETHDIDADDEDKGDDEEKLDELGQKTQKERKRWIEAKMKRTREKKRSQRLYQGWGCQANAEPVSAFPCPQGAFKVTQLKSSGWKNWKEKHRLL